MMSVGTPVAARINRRQVLGLATLTFDPGHDWSVTIRQPGPKDGAPCLADQRGDVEELDEMHTI